MADQFDHWRRGEPASGLRADAFDHWRRGEPASGSEKIAVSYSRATTDTAVGGAPDLLARVVLHSVSDVGCALEDVLALVAGPPNQAVLDGFNRADAATLGAAWASVSGFVDFSVVGNKAVDPSGTTYAWDYWATQYGPNCSFGIKLALPPSTPGESVRVFARLLQPNTSNRSGYAVQATVVSASVVTWVIQRITSGSPTSISSAVSLGPLSAGDKIAIQCEGQTITAWWFNSLTGKWMIVASVQDATYSAVGYSAMQSKQAQLDDFTGGGYGTLFAHALTDSALAQSDGIGTQDRYARVLADAGLTAAAGDALVRGVLRFVSDTGVGANQPGSISRSLHRFASDPAAVTMGDSVGVSAATLKHPGLLDTAVNPSDSTVRSTKAPRAAADNGLTPAASSAIARSYSHFATPSGGFEICGNMLVSYQAGSLARAITDSGLASANESLVRKVGVAPPADIGVSPGSSIVRSVGRVFNSVGASVGSALGRAVGRGSLDTAVTPGDTLAERVARVCADTAIASSASSVAVALGRGVADVAATITESATRVPGRVANDQACVVTDSVLADLNATQVFVSWVEFQVPVALSARFLSDQGTSNSDLIAEIDSNRRALSDTALAISDSIQRIESHSLTDRAQTPSDSLAKARATGVADGAVTITDSLAMQVSLHEGTADDLTFSDSLASNVSDLRVLFDTLLVTDAIVPVRIYSPIVADVGAQFADSTRVGILVADSDVGATISDSLASLAADTRETADTALALSDSFASERNKVLFDTGFDATDLDVLSVGASYLRTQTDPGASLGDSLGIRVGAALTDQALIVSDAVGRVVVRLATDVAAAISDQVDHAGAIARAAVDTGVALTDAAALRLSPALADTAYSQIDTLDRAHGATRVTSDTGASIADGIVPTGGVIVSDFAVVVGSDALAVRYVLRRSLSDTAAVASDAFAAVVARRVADTALAVSEAASRQAAHARALADTGTAISDATTEGVSRSAADTACSVADFVAQRTAHFFTDQASTVIDRTAILAARFAQEPGAQIIDSLAVRHGVDLEDDARFDGDTLDRRYAAGRIVGDTLVFDDVLVLDVWRAPGHLDDRAMHLTEAISLATGRRLTEGGVFLFDAAMVTGVIPYLFLPLAVLVDSPDNEAALDSPDSFVTLV